MASSSRKIDRFFLLTVGLLTVCGFVIFLSASLGLLAQDGASFSIVATKQAISLVVGISLFFILSKINYKIFRKSALFILIAAVAVNLLLFIPGLTLHVNGATRWIDLGIFSFQPSELLKVAFIIYLAAWIHFAKDKIKSMKFGLFPYLVMLGILSILLLAQRDTDTLLIIAGTGLIMMMIGGMPLRHVGVAIVIIGVLVAGVLVVRPYAMERVKTFLDKGADAQGSGYQINQSLIAIGSGGLSGRGFGQSVQKFGYLPQPTDDSIFAVAAEEFGFVGGLTLIIFYVLFAASAFRVGNKSQDVFGGMFSVGIVILVVIESFMNISAMLGLIPLSGVPLLFVSHGGTALVIALMTAGIVANISKRI